MEFHINPSSSSLDVLRGMVLQTWRKTRQTPLEREYHTVLKQIDYIKPSIWNLYRNNLNAYNFKPPKHKNRAFFKLWEILHRYTLTHQEIKTSTLHLCEAPGTFVMVINTLFPHVPTLSVSKNGHEPHLTFFPDIQTVPQNEFRYFDVREPAFFRFLAERGETYDFITADGGIDEGGCFSQKEVLHMDLIVAEIAVALLVLTPGGTFILKTFEWFDSFSIQWLYILSLSFRSVHVYKPLTSRPTNSERYIICQDFHGCPPWWTALRAIEVIEYVTQATAQKGTFPAIGDLSIPSITFEHISNINKQLIKQQIKSVKEVLSSIHSQRYLNAQEAESLKQQAFLEWKRLYHYDDDLGDTGETHGRLCGDLEGEGGDGLTS